MNPKNFSRLAAGLALAALAGAAQAEAGPTRRSPSQRWPHQQMPSASMMQVPLPQQRGSSSMGACPCFVQAPSCALVGV